MSTMTMTATMMTMGLNIDGNDSDDDWTDTVAGKIYMKKKIEDDFYIRLSFRYLLESK
jgi:hypothetical protein